MRSNLQTRKNKVVHLLDEKIINVESLEPYL